MTPLASPIGLIVGAIIVFVLLGLIWSVATLGVRALLASALSWCGFRVGVDAHPDAPEARTSALALAASEDEDLPSTRNDCWHALDTGHDQDGLLSIDPIERAKWGGAPLDRHD